MEHEIQLGFWHHGRVPGHSDIQKNQSRKDFPAIKFLFCKIVTISLNFPPDCSSQIDILLFFPKNCGEIFSNVVFLLVLIGSYPAMMPVSQLDFMLLTDISKVVCTLRPPSFPFLHLKLVNKAQY